MRLATRTFLWSIVPFALLLTGSFWAVQTMVFSAVRDELRSNVKVTQASVMQMRSRAEQKNGRILRIVAENPALKAGVQLLLGTPGDRQARNTVENQLLEMCQELGFDFLIVSDADGGPLVAVMRDGEQPATFDLTKIRAAPKGYFHLLDRTYQFTSVPIDQGNENLGILSVGEQVDLSGIPVPAMLMHDGIILTSNIAPRSGMSIAGAERALIEAALRNCSEQAECEIPLKGEAYVSSSLESEETGNGGYQLRSWQSVDAAVRPIHSILRGVFLLTGVGALAGAVFVSGLSSRSIVRPIMCVIAHLRKAEKTGELPEFRSTAEYGRIREIRELTGTFNRAGAAIREARARLERANVEFIESLASALDARDPYTAGHSRRVSEFACAIADAMGLDRNALGEIRIGALLHDIGKIGVSDSVLLKPGRLTPEENALIQQHPSIGRRILEGVNGFQPYLGVVELHHENWDGTGYPHGLRGEDTPQTARIVKLADAYDAMTSDRPYRKGMSHADALVIFEKVAGSQMDPAVVEAFQNLEPVALHATAAQNGADSLRRLAEAVQDVKRRESALEPVEGNKV